MKLPALCGQFPPLGGEVWCLSMRAFRGIVEKIVKTPGWRQMFVKFMLASIPLNPPKARHVVPQAHHSAGAAFAETGQR